MRRSFFAVAAAVFPLFFGGPVQSQALDTEVHRTCLAAPSTGCLLDLAEIERDEFWRVSPGDAAFSQDNWLEYMARVEVVAGELDRASTHLTQMEPRNLLHFIYDKYDEYPDLPAKIDAEGKILVALEKQLAVPKSGDERASADIERRANIALALSGLGYADRATEVLALALEDFVDALDENDTEIVVAASDLMEAAIGIGADDAAVRLTAADGTQRIVFVAGNTAWPATDGQAASYE